MKKLDVDELREFIKTQSDRSVIYLGADSFRIRIKGVWYAKFTTVVVVHMNGCNGARVFGEIVQERDYTVTGKESKHEQKQKLKKPRMRLMREVQLVAELYLKLGDLLEDKLVEIHLDLNKDEKHGSSVVVKEAVGYITGVTGIVPKTKPDSFIASHCADHFRSYE